LCHGCPVQQTGLQYRSLFQSKVVITGLVPVINAFHHADPSAAGVVVGMESGHDISDSFIMSDGPA
jgi:hypothetical protein